MDDASCGRIIFFNSQPYNAAMIQRSVGYRTNIAPSQKSLLPLKERIPSQERLHFIPTERFA
jgi:hypothetical protein